MQKDIFPHWRVLSVQAKHHNINMMLIMPYVLDLLHSKNMTRQWKHVTLQLKMHQIAGLHITAEDHLTSGLEILVKLKKITDLH